MARSLFSEHILRVDQLGKLIQTLLCEGYQVIGPTLRDGAIVYDNVDQCRISRPAGPMSRSRDVIASRGAKTGRCSVTQSDRRAGRSTFTRRKCGYVEAERDGETFRILNNAAEASTRYAFLGVRACELAAIGCKIGY